MKRIWVIIPIVIVLFLAVFLPWGKRTDEKWRRNKAYNADGSLANPAFGPTAPKRVVSAGIRYGRTVLMIQNQNDFDWPATSVHLNGILLGFEFNAGFVKAGATVSIPLNEFAKGSGERFQPDKYKPREVVVTVSGCDSPVYHFD